MGICKLQKAGRAQQGFQARPVTPGCRPTPLASPGGLEDMESPSSHSKCQATPLSRLHQGSAQGCHLRPLLGIPWGADHAEARVRLRPGAEPGSSGKAEGAPAPQLLLQASVGTENDHGEQEWRPWRGTGEPGSAVEGASWMGWPPGKLWPRGSGLQHEGGTAGQGPQPLVVGRTYHRSTPDGGLAGVRHSLKIALSDPHMASKGVPVR